MRPIREIISSPASKAAILLLGFLLIFVWFQNRVDNEQNSGAAEASLSEDYIVIPSLGLKAPIIYVDSFEEQAIQNGLQNGVVHLKGTAKPGEIGNSYIVGHSSNYPGTPGSYNSIFSKLPDLKIGDDILLMRGSSQSLVFKVSDIKIISSDDLSVLSQSSQKRRLLTLQTSYPIGTAPMRYLVVAELK